MVRILARKCKYGLLKIKAFYDSRVLVLGKIPQSGYKNTYYYLYC